MKKHWILLALASALLLTACSGSAAADITAVKAPPEARTAEPQSDSPAVPEYQPPEYEITPMVYGSQFQAEDGSGEVLAQYNYQIVLLALHNADAVSPEDLETAERNIENFNAKMDSISSDLVEQGKSMADDATSTYQEFGPLTAGYEDDVDGGAEFCGDIVSVCYHRNTYSGGAHPNRYSSSYLFDLNAGQFIDPTQLAEDPETFRTGAAELLLTQAENHPEQEMFWQDYKEIVERWSEATVQFSGDGMRVTFSPYELGAYAIGEVEMSLSWEELEPLLGKTGMLRLGHPPEGEISES